MKKLLIIYSLGLLLGGIYITNLQSRDRKVNFLFQEVEALARNESNSDNCSVTCPNGATITCGGISVLEPCETGSNYVVCFGNKISC